MCLLGGYMFASTGIPSRTKIQKAQSQMEHAVAAGEEDEDPWFVPQSLHFNISTCQGRGRATDEQKASVVNLSDDNLVVRSLIFSNVLQTV